MTPSKLLTIDIGNTHTVLGVYDGEVLLAHWRMSTGQERTLDEMKVFIRGFFAAEAIEAESISGVAIASVVPALTHVFEDISLSLFNVKPVVVGPGIKTSMPIRYEDPREVGADRIVNAVAAYAKYGKELIAVDFGTATTLDVVDASGAYLGGVIAPGLGVSMEALFTRASKLPKIALDKPPRVVGRNTVNSMQSGVWYGYASMVDGLIERVKEELGGEPVVVATGGNARTLCQESKMIDHVEEFLTLEGLRLLYEMNENAHG